MILSSSLRDVDMVVIMVEHLELRDNLSMLKGKVVLDTRQMQIEGAYLI